MKKYMLTRLILSLTIFATIQNQSVPQETLSQIPKEITDLHEELEHKRQQKFLKTSSAALGVAVMSAYTIYALKKSSPPKPQKRFVTDAIAATSLTASLLQGAAGCVAGAYSFYKIRQWLYDGYVREKELEKTLTTLRNTFAEGINNHAKIIESLNSELEDLKRVGNAHAADLDEGRQCARRTDSAIQSIYQAINDHASILQKGGSPNPAFIQQESIIIPGRVQEHAAIPGNNLPTIQTSTPATILIKKTKSDCCCQ